MPRTTETFEQRQARTAKARAARQAKFRTDEERSEYYRELVRRRWAKKKEAAA